MPAVHRWFFCSLGAFACGLALAQTAATPAATPKPPEVDESKIPEWVKRQARSPYKVIIESNAVRGRAAAAAAREEGNGKQAPKKTVAAVAPAPAAVEPRVEAAVARTADPPSRTSSVAAVPQAAEPVIETAAAPVSKPAVTPLPNASAAAQQPAAQGQAEPEPALRVATASAATAEPMPLTLLLRVEPAIPSELIDSKLNSAKVVVTFTVNPDGEVVKPSIASTSDPRLNRSVLRAVRDWRYAPIETAREHSVRLEFSTQ
jgi:TonB family protein